MNKEVLSLLVKLSLSYLREAVTEVTGHVSVQGFGEKARLEVLI